MPAKESPAEAAAPIAEAVPLEEQVSCADWCARKSESDRRVELIGAFFSVESSAGRHHDLPANYATRFVAFTNAPA